jgi:hypothetical protein
MQAVVAASAGLLLAAVAPLARETLTSTLAMLIAAVCTVLMFRKANPLWLVLGASAAGLVAAVIS